MRRLTPINGETDLCLIDRVFQAPQKRGAAGSTQATERECHAFLLKVSAKEKMKTNMHFRLPDFRKQFVSGL